MPSTLKDVRDSFADADGDGFSKESFTKTFGEYLLIGKYLDPLEWTTGDPKIPQINMLEGKLNSIEKTVCTGLLATDDGPFRDAAAYWAKHGSAQVETLGGQIKHCVRVSTFCNDTITASYSADKHSSREGALPR